MKKNSFPQRNALAILLAIALAGCAAERIHTEGISLIQEGRLEEGISKLEEAKQADPGNASFKKDWLLQRDRLINALMQDATKEKSEQHWDAALQRYNRVLKLDRNNVGARQAINEITVERRQDARVDDAALLYGKGDLDQASSAIGRVLVENPTHPRAVALRSQILEATSQNSSLNGVSLNFKGKKPVTLQFRDANLRMVMEAIAKTTGLNVLFDKDVKADLKVTIFVRDTPVEEAIDLILMQTQTAKRIMGENSILIYADTETKSREYAELKIRRFAITNADPKNVMAMVKTMTKTKDMFVDEKTNSLVVRDTPQIIRMVEKLIVAMDQPEPEVMLEVDVMEISRDRALALGIDLPTSFGTSVTSLTLDQLTALGRNDFFSSTGVTVTAKKTDSDVNTLATPRIRVRNKEKAKFLVGDRLPVISSAATPSVTGGTSVYNTSVQYVEVGIKIEAEPTVYADGEVAIRLALEVSSAGLPNADAAKTGTIAYTIGTRSVNTVLRLKDGQTEVIGGLIQDEDTSGATRVPGLGDIPLLGRLFGKQTDTRNKKEIIMSITPRIVRNNRQVDSDLLEMWSGTENNMRFGTRQVGNAKLQPTTAAAPASGGGTVAVAPTGASSATAQTSTPTPAPTPAATSTPTATPAPALLPGAPVAARPLPRSNPPPAASARPAAAAAPAAALRAMTLAAPARAKVGEKISVSLSFPPVAAATMLETSLSYDSGRLKLIAVNESDSARNNAAGARFTGDGDSPGSVRIELSAGRGETLPATGGALAQLQFEVLPGEGSTQLSLGAANVQNADSGSVTLPETAAFELDVKAAP